MRRVVDVFREDCGQRGIELEVWGLEVRWKSNGLEYGGLEYCVIC